ncbi:MAG: hypothetical protein V2I97_12990 [Desulfococcaceae bacterium]|nr:hypothetical protein [Desulfococcaceae bacterium]
MKRKMIVRTSFLSLCFLACCSCYAGNYRRETSSVPAPPGAAETSARENSRDAEVIAFLGPELLEFLARAGHVESYRIDPRRKSGDIKQRIQGYPVLSRGRDLNEKQLRQFLDILRSSSSYEFQWSKRTRIRPVYAFRFALSHATAASADIFIDPNSRQWAFFFRNQMKEEDISKSAAEKLYEITENIFMP